MDFILSVKTFWKVLVQEGHYPQAQFSHQSEGWQCVQRQSGNLCFCIFQPLFPDSSPCRSRCQVSWSLLKELEGSGNTFANHCDRVTARAHRLQGTCLAFPFSATLKSSPRSLMVACTRHDGESLGNGTPRIPLCKIYLQLRNS